MANRILTLAALSGFIAVAFGAFAAHILQTHFSEQQSVWVAKGWQYQVFHTLALLALGLFGAATQHREWSARAKSAVGFIAVFWIIGICCFSFSLYAMAVFNTKSFAAIVPVGGVAFLIGWGILCVSAARGRVFDK